LTPLSWAGNFVLGRALHETIPPIALSFWRWAVALLILLPFAPTSLRKQRTLLRRRWPILTLIGKRIAAFHLVGMSRIAGGLLLATSKRPGRSA